MKSHNKIWVTSDTHFYHDNLVEKGIRPADFSRVIAANWMHLVNSEDTVIHLGDVTWDGLSYIDCLPGRKILVKGNHDNRSLAAYMKAFDFVCDSFTLQHFGLNMLFTHAPVWFHDCDVNIHGHLHNLAEIHVEYCRHHLISLEKTGYKPILLESIAADIRKRIAEEG